MAAATDKNRASPAARSRSGSGARAPRRSTPPRLSYAFAAALLLHGLLALTLPDLRRLLLGSAATPPAQPTAPAPRPPLPGSELIPIRLPLAGFQLQSELGAIARDSPARSTPLPGTGHAPSGRLAISSRLGAAAGEARAAYERLQPSPAPVATTTRLVAELRLADGGARGRGSRSAGLELGSGDSGTVTASRAPASEHDELAAAAEAQQTPTPTPAAAARPTVPVTAPTPRPPRKPAVPAAQPRLAPAPIPAPAAPPKPPAAVIQQPIRPQVYPPAAAYRGAAPDAVAEAPPLPAAGVDDASAPPLTAGNALMLGAQAAPDRGPGAAVAGRGAFFQQLTTHLFTVNQQVLAEAIRATPRLTLEVRFTIDRSGRVLGAQLLRSTGDDALDRKAVDVILRASPVPQMAPDMPQARIELSFPVQIYR